LELQLSLGLSGLMKRGLCLTVSVLFQTSSATSFTNLLEHYDQFPSVMLLCFLFVNICPSNLHMEMTDDKFLLSHTNVVFFCTDYNLYVVGERLEIKSMRKKEIFQFVMSLISSLLYKWQVEVTYLCDKSDILVLFTAVISY
jgi:hypothetical protein